MWALNSKGQQANAGVALANAETGAKAGLLRKIYGSSSTHSKNTVGLTK